MRKSGWAALLSLALSFGLGLSQGWALGGSGTEQDSGGDTVRKLKMLPLDEKNTRTYGWVRISADTLSLGANHLPPDTVYTVYFVNEAEKQVANTEETVTRTSGRGEAKFTMRLTEPLGAKWEKIVLFHHVDGREALDGELQPVMEAKLR